MFPHAGIIFLTTTSGELSDKDAACCLVFFVIFAIFIIIHCKD